MARAAAEAKVETPGADAVAARTEALGAWLAVPDRIAEWAGFRPTRPGTRAVLSRLHARLLPLGKLLAHSDALSPGALERMAQAELSACAFGPDVLDDVWADLGGAPTAEPCARRHAAQAALLEAVAVGLSIAAGLMKLPVIRD